MNTVWWLCIAGWVLIGLGVARYNVATEYAEMVEYHVKEKGRTVGSARARIAEDDGPLFLFITVLSLLSWPLMLAWVLLIKPIGTTVGPLIARWWRAPRERMLKSKGYT